MTSRIKVLLLSTSESGGGGISAKQIKSQFDDVNFEISMLTRKNSRNFNQSKNFIWYSKNLYSKVITYINRLITKGKYGFTSATSVNFITLDTIRKLSPDVIHIHNWYNLVDLQMIEEIAKRYPVILTAHDSRLLTGACHVLLDCKNYQSGCSNCPAVRVLKSKVAYSKNRMREILDSQQNITLTSPSKWLADLLNESYGLSGDKQVIQVHNFIDSEFQKLEIIKPKTSKLNFLFVAASLDSPFKGGELLVDALNRYLEITEDEGKSFELVLVGNGNLSFLKKAVFKYKVIKSPSTRGLVDVYSESDLLIVPSLADNFPSVIIESQLLGLPVLATQVGGVPEIVVNGETGFLSDATSDALANALSSITIRKMNEVAEKAFNYAHTHFESSAVNAEYRKLYTKAVSDA